ncbi:hypothetical protein V3C99_018632, partial [Haemonchus contortus]|uniref:Reverse transcriptase domain-containing protein n=1 Tax=Haemonchus contortus TaxID=6289 RepID=A0A7I5EDU1_HAECO
SFIIGIVKEMDNNTACSRNMAENFAGPAGKSPTLQLKTQAPQTNGREVRNVLGEVQRTVRQQSHRSPPKEDDQMDTDTNTDEKEFDDVSKPDWSALRSTLEAAFGEIGRTSSQHTRGAEIRAKSGKGHLEYTCGDGCLNGVKLGEVAGIQLPRAFPQKPMGSRRIRRRVREDSNERVEYQPIRESAREGGGMSVSRSVICTRKRRALGGKQTT